MAIASFIPKTWSPKLLDVYKRPLPFLALAGRDYEAELLEYGDTVHIGALTPWVVFAGQDAAGQVVICNPGIGRYGIDKGTFKSLYSGVSLWNGEPHDLPEEAS